MATFTTLSKLTYNDLSHSPAWRAIGDYANDKDKSLASLDSADGKPISANVEEVWCLSLARFANGSEHKACAMCRGNCAEGPLAWSVWNGNKDVPVILPPAPPPVLKIDGPEVFAASFHLPIDEVFPILFKVIPKFASRPESRAVILDVTGVKPVQ